MRLLLAIAVTIGLLAGCGYIQDAADTTFQETKASTLLKKYEWFKDASAQLDKKRADIQVYDRRVKDLLESYRGTPRKDWPRDDREQLGVWTQEVAGVKASYNALAAEYNAAMSKINYRFTNVGDLPQGASTPLPREYRAYETN